MTTTDNEAHGNSDKPYSSGICGQFIISWYNIAWIRSRAKESRPRANNGKEVKSAFNGMDLCSKERPRARNLS